MSFNGHAKFVAKELEKIQETDAPKGGADSESATPPIDPSEAAERDELGRVAQAVCA